MRIFKIDQFVNNRCKRTAFSQTNVASLIPEIFNFIEVLKGQDELNSEETTILLKLKLANFVKVVGTESKKSVLADIQASF